MFQLPLWVKGEDLEVLTKVEKIAEQPTSSFSPSFPPLKSYASVSKKHLLIVKSTVDSQKATEKKVKYQMHFRVYR